MSRFQTVEQLPRMEKYLFAERFAADPRSDKILASTGAYKNEKGEVPAFECVRIGTERVRKRKLSKGYLDVAGYQPFKDAVKGLIFAETGDQAFLERLIVTHTPGGTAALRIGADFIKSQWPDTSIWVTDPTWGNHIKVFQTAGLSVKKYPYYDAAKREIQLDNLLANIEAIPDGDVIFLQASTHNPTCVDPTPEQWEQMAILVARKGLLPFFDLAFFGFSNGIREDLEGLRIFCQRVEELMVASSFSKSFALYNDRIGSLVVLGPTKEAAQNVTSHLRHLIRANYSNPPLDGAAVVTEILSDPELVQMWEEEIARIRLRTRSCRERMVHGLRTQGAKNDLSYILREKGLFTMLGLSQQSIKELNVCHGIFISATGRINVTSMTDEQLDNFCEIVAKYIP